MNGNDREQTELLRNIWQQMVQLDRSLNQKIDGLRTELVLFREQTHANFARVQRNFDRVLDRADRSDDRVDDLDARVTRLEQRAVLRDE